MLDAPSRGLTFGRVFTYQSEHGARPIGRALCFEGENFQDARITADVQDTEWPLGAS
jgi:hypothetical protein